MLRMAIIARMKKDQQRPGLGNVIAPFRFVLFALIILAVTPVAILNSEWRMGTMIGFDLAALTFLLSLIPLFRRGDTQAMRKSAAENDANRAILLAITTLVSLVILVAVASELSQKAASDPPMVALIIGTLALAWTFSNMVYALHYAHMFYSAGGDGKDLAGICFPATKEPQYGDFTYFALTLGMTFQTSDVDIERTAIRSVVTVHCLAAFVFNLGILAFTINVLGS